MAAGRALLLLLPLLLLAGMGLTQQVGAEAAIRARAANRRWAVGDGGESAGRDYYTAGVVEFRPAKSGDDKADLRDNLNGYLEVIMSPNASAADIIIFPEMTANSVSTACYVPKPELKVSPCETDSAGEYYGEFLMTISCFARKVRKYIVINVNEDQACFETPNDPRPCAPTAHNVFNTNVVFDRNGVVISRYRKIHLYGEPRNTTYEPEFETFETDFNVTFGHFICFDLLFYTPAQQLIEKQGIRDFVFPTMWFSQLPFLSAVQVQLGWAYGNDVNLLAAGASRVEVGNSGTGIFNGRRGTITSVMRLASSERRIYVARVPKYQPAESPRRTLRQLQSRSQEPAPPKLQPAAESPGSARFLMKRDTLEQYETVWLPQSGNVTQDVCHGQLCCHFELDWSLLVNVPDEAKRTGYRLGAYDGWRSEHEVNYNYLRVCGIFACNGSAIEDCGLFLGAEQLQHRFDRLSIEAVYPKSREFLLMPNSVRDNLLPLEPSQFEWSVQVVTNKSNEMLVRFALAESEPLSGLLTFAIYGNYYDDICTFGTSAGAGADEEEEEERQCGFEPAGDGAVQLGRLGSWAQLPLLTGLIFRLSSFRWN